MASSDHHRLTPRDQQEVSLFGLVKKNVLKYIQDNVLCCMLFVDDILWGMLFVDDILLVGAMREGQSLWQKYREKFYNLKDLELVE